MTADSRPISDPLYVVGLMSGTSADGIDAALCAISGAPPALAVRVVKTASLPYDRAFRERVLALCAPGTVDAACRLHADLGERFAAAVAQVTGDVTPDLIGSHGQTIWHDVAGSRVTSTLQIGAAAVIAERSGVTTISNFRQRDVAAGGHGAPLTAYVDWLLLRHPVHWRAVQNIGGMGNVSLLPPLSDTESRLIAFDTGPGNALIDAAVSAITGEQQVYDVDGAMAAAGRVDAGWLAELLAHPYFEQPPPRTTGRETFGTTMALDLLASGRGRGLADHDIVATLTALTAHSIADSYTHFAPVPPREVILGGGGAHNPALVTMLRERLPGVDLHSHEALGLDTDFKEAMVFAVLAYETWHARAGSLPEQTGAAHGTVLGDITPGANYRDLIRRTWTAT